MTPEEKAKIVVDFLEKKYGKRVRKKMRSNPFKLLIETMISQRSREENTRKVSRKLFSIAKKPENIIALGEKRLAEIIKPAGLHKQKAKNIIKVCDYIKKNGVPKDRKSLIELPGVGKKTADIVLSYGYGKPVIAVDVHVEVCSKRIGLVKKDSGYEDTKKRLESLVPENKRYLINLGFVNFGREICLTKKPKCEICEIRYLCDYKKVKV